MLGGVVWRTCLREIAFVDESTGVPDDARVFQDEAAYAHLLSVICGLGSPVVGETEVMHQFKAFAAGLADEHAALKELSHRLLVDARLVRSRHLVGLGSRSYGSAVRRHVRDCERVAIVGTGILAREVLPFLHDGSRAVDVWGRREQFETDIPAVTYRRLSGACGLALGGRSAIVIAAPIPSAEISRLLPVYTGLVRLIDLRAEGPSDPPPPAPSLVSLAAIFRELQEAQDAADRQAEAARAEIGRRARDYATRARLYPSGWHDLWA